MISFAFRNSGSSQQDTVGFTNSNNRRKHLEATYSATNGAASERGKNINYEKIGPKGSFVGSETFIQSKTFVEVYDGSVSISESEVRHYGAEMYLDDPPVFNKLFVQDIRELHVFTKVVS